MKKSGLFLRSDSLGSSKPLRESVRSDFVSIENGMWVTRGLFSVHWIANHGAERVRNLFAEEFYREVCAWTISRRGIREHVQVAYSSWSRCEAQLLSHHSGVRRNATDVGDSFQENIEANVQRLFRVFQRDLHGSRVSANSGRSTGARRTQRLAHRENRNSKRWIPPDSLHLRLLDHSHRALVRIQGRHWRRSNPVTLKEHAPGHASRSWLSYWATSSPGSLTSKFHT